MHSGYDLNKQQTEHWCRLGQRAIKIWGDKKGGNNRWKRRHFSIIVGLMLGLLPQNLWDRVHYLLFVWSPVLYILYKHAPSGEICYSSQCTWMLWPHSVDQLLGSFAHTSDVTSCTSKYNIVHTQSGFPLTPKRTFLRPQNRSKTYKIVGVITASNEHTSNILGQDVSIHPLLDICSQFE